ncbi:PBSX family phage terminase large subunit [Pseudomonas sp. NPDC098747]|uniref:PBSX family phage terminase large subunit n=1 Tax=Pseudomonas sp. NPDC098747 TaxID=3364487 RepID=UPI00383AB1D3
MQTEIFPVYADYLQPARFKVAYGGRGSAKTRTFVAILKNNVLHYGWRLVCFREIMKSLDDSVYQEFIDEIERCEQEQYFRILRNEIHCDISGGVIKFDGLFRNQQKLKGYAGFDAAWVEEAANVTAASWKFLIPTLRKNRSEIWVSYNPENPLDETHKRFVTACPYPEYIDGQRYTIIKKINYTDNPRFPIELQRDLDIMREQDYELFRHVYLGEPVADSALAIIKPAWIAAAINAHLVLGWEITGGRFMGFDVADEGPDSNATIGRHGVLVNTCKEWRDNDPNSAARATYAEALEHSVDLIIFDNIGVGAGAKGALREEVAATHESGRWGPEMEGFNAGGAVIHSESDYAPGKKNQDMFLNLKAQAWWTLADRFKSTFDAVNGRPYDKEKVISLAGDLPGLDKLCAELSQPRREYVNGKVKVEGKGAMKKRGVSSPNLADALVMCFSNELEVQGGLNISEEVASIFE